MATAKRIAIIDGHPDAREGRYVHALADAYAEGARSAGHEVSMLRIGALDFPLLHRAQDFTSGRLPASIRMSQQTLQWADHWVILYPLWLGSMPAVLKGFLEQVFRPGFGFDVARKRALPRKMLKGKSARIVVTMGMPSLFYRWYFRAHSLKSLERNILAFCGVAPIKASIVGMVEGSKRHRDGWLLKMRALGRRAQ